jgi:hypothetical protein
VKNKNLLIGIGIAIAIIVIGGGVFFLNKSKSNPTTTNQTQNQESGTISKLSPQDIGLTLSASPDNKKVKFSIAHTSGIKSVSYEITYEAESTVAEREEGADARVQRGITGDAKITGGSYTSEWLDLGSCSRNVCKYDVGVTEIQLILKITKTDGKVYEVEQSLSL